MNNFTNETPSELLTQMLDGELDSQSEQFLYDELSISTELQEEMKHHLAVRGAISKDTEAFTPPSAAVKAVFDSLGYAPPPNVSHGIIRRSPLLLSLFKRVTVPLLLLLVGSFAAYNLLNNQNSETTKINSIVTDSDKLDPLVENSFADNSKLVGDTKFAAKSDFKKKSNHKISVMESSEQLENQTFSSATTSSVGSQPNIIEFEKPVQAYLYQVNQSNFDSNIEIVNINSLNNGMQFNPVVNFSEISNTQSKTLTLYAKGFNNINSDLGSAFTNSDNSINNFSAGITFLSTGSLKGGLEIGQQLFNVKVSDESELNLINNNKSVFWVAASLKYDAEFIEVSGVHPYIQLSAGSGTFGNGMVRYSVGFDIKPFNSSLGLIAGYEGSTLWYSTLDTPFSTSTDGIFLGISVGL